MAKAWGYAGYATVSLQDEMPNQFGLHAQRTQIERYFAEKLAPRGIEWGDMLADPGNANGKHLADLPVRAALFDLAQAGDHVVIAKLEGALRKPWDFADDLGRWLANGVYVHIHLPHLDIGWIDSSGADGYLMASMLVDVVAVCAEMDVNNRRELINEAKALARQKGLFQGGYAPLGFKVVGRSRNQRLVPDDESRAQMVFIAERVAEGWQFPEIRDLLNKNKMRWKKPVPKNSRRSGRATFTLEPWSPKRVGAFYAAWQGICEKEGLELLPGMPVEQAASY